MQPGRHPNSLAVFFSERREQHIEATRRLEAALQHGSDSEIVEAAERVRSLGAVGPNIRWDAVYVVEERYREIQALRLALAEHNDQASAEAWSRVRARYEDYLTETEREAGLAAFLRWGRRSRISQRDEPTAAS